MNILDLPSEVLAKVLGFLPLRTNYGAVCRKFYDIICHIDKCKYILKFGATEKSVRQIPFDNGNSSPRIKKTFLLLIFLDY
jgi:hypothetical protein